MEKLRKISTMYYVKQILACLLVYCILLAVPIQVALSVDPGNVVNIPAGSVNFTGSTTGNTVVNVLSNKAIINWSNFDTIPGEWINFLRETDFALLNRVVYGGPTNFWGTLNAPLGNVFLINSRGIMFGPTSFINARNFVASGLGMRDLDFINGDLVNPDNINYRFGYGDRFGLGPADLKSVTVDTIGDVTLLRDMVSGAEIDAETIALIGKSVLNQGTIRTTTGGAVIMAAGETVLLSEVGSDVVVEVTMTDPAQHVVDHGGNQGTGPGTIEASSGNVGKVVLAAGDIFSTAISGVGSLAAVANRNIELYGDFEAGEMTITADADDSGGPGGGYVYATGATIGTSGNLTSTTSDIEISASDNTIFLNVDIDAAEDLLLNNNTQVAPSKTFKAGQDVILADGKTMYGWGALTIEGDRDIILGGAVTASGTMSLKADADTINMESGGTVGGIMLAKENLKTTAGDIDIYGYNIILDGDSVEAASDLTLHNNTRVADNINLKAGNNVDSPAHLTALGNLAIEATGGAITAHEITMPAAPAPSTTLTLTQNNKLDMEQNVTVINRPNTHLVATSFADSVTSAAAAKWLDIKATADENITLSDESGNITTLQLTATNGDVKINANDGKLFAQGPISAGRDVKITATDESYDPILMSDASILLHEDIVAGRDIWLNNNTYAYGPIWLTAGQDMRLGYNENLDTYEAKTLTAEESLTIEADRHVTLGGDVTVIGSEEPQTLIIKADADTVNEEPEPVPGGDVWAMGKLTTIGGENNDILVYGDNIRVDGMVSSADDIVMKAADDLTLASNVEAGGNIDLYSSDDTTYLGGDHVLATGNLTLHNNTVLNGTDDPDTTPDNEGDQRIEATNGTLTAMKDVDKSTPGSMTLAGGNSIILSGDVTGTGMESGDSIIFEDNVTANGTGDAEDQTLDAGLGALWAWDTITKTAGDDLTLGGDEGLDLDGTVDVQTTSGSLYIEDDFTAAGDLLAERYVIISDLILTNDEWVNGEFDGVGTQKVQARNAGLTVNNDEYPESDEPYLKKTTAGNLELRSAHSLSLHSHVTVQEGELIVNGGTMGSGVTLMGNLWSSGNMTLTSNGGGLGVEGNAESESGSVEMTATGNGIRLYSRSWGQDVTAGQDIVLNDDTTVYYSGATLDAGRDVTLADNQSLIANGALTIEADRDITLGGPVNANGSFEAYAGLDTGLLGGDILAKDNIEAASIVLSASNGEGYSYSHVVVAEDKTLKSTVGDITVEAHHDVSLGGAVKSAGSLNILADQHNNYYEEGDPDPVAVTHIYGGDVDADDTLAAKDNIQISGNNIDLEEDVVAGGSIELTSGTSHDFMENWVVTPYDEMYAAGNLLAGTNVTINGNLTLDGYDELTTPDVDESIQTIDADTGKITANGWLHKNSPGSLYLEADGDISLDDYVKADFGGVSIISEEGKIFTPDELGNETDTLNVAVSGTSNQGTGAGVKLNPDMDNKAAIVIKSREDLKLGEGAVLTASGLYGGVDDRAAVGLLDTDGTFIGGALRDEGEPIDIAIYLASTEGDVDFSGSARITNYYSIRNNTTGDSIELPEIPEFEPQGTMVIDAYDTVTLGEFGETLERFIDVDRLEVVSRITEWLFQAVGRLPFVYDPAAIAAFEDFIGGDYIFRGAGLNNPAIKDGRAWVLEDPTPPAPLYEEAGQTAERLTIGLEGCPVLVAAASAELGIPSDTIQVSLANSFALNTNIQPCESCARLLNAAEILSDEDGSGMAALNQVFNTVAPADVAFTPEVAASIVTAFAGRVNDGTQYATAIDYIDAFVRYIAVLDAEMGSPVGDGDSVAFVMEKYGSGITDSDNSNIAAFIATRLESGETFGE